MTSPARNWTKGPLTVPDRAESYAKVPIRSIDHYKPVPRLFFLAPKLAVLILSGLAIFSALFSPHFIGRVLGVQAQGGSAVTLDRVLDDDFNLSLDGYVEGSRLQSTATSGSPLTVLSSSLVSSLNADLLDGQHGSYYIDLIDDAASEGGWVDDGTVVRLATSSDHVGIGTTSPDSTLHVFSGNAGSYTPSVNGDDLVVENSTHTGVTLISPANKETWLVMANPSSVGWMRYVQTGGPYLQWAVGGTARMELTTSALRFKQETTLTTTVGDLVLNPTGDVGVGTSSPWGTLHVQTGSSGATPHAVADDLVVENSTDGGISILTPNGNVGYILFGSPSGNNNGYFGYNNTSHKLTLAINGTPRFDFTSSSLDFSQATSISTPGTDDLTLAPGGSVSISGANATTLELGSSTAEGGNVEIFRDASGNRQVFIDADAAETGVGMLLYGLLRVGNTAAVEIKGSNAQIATTNASNLSLAPTGTYVNLPSSRRLSFNTDRLEIYHDTSSHIISSFNALEIANTANSSSLTLSSDNATDQAYDISILPALGKIAINNNSFDVDFQVQGSTDVDLIYANAGLEAVGVGTNAPGAKLEVVGDTNDDSAYAFDARNSDDRSLFFARNDGTLEIGNALLVGSSTSVTIHPQLYSMEASFFEDGVFTGVATGNYGYLGVVEEYGYEGIARIVDQTTDDDAGVQVLRIGLGTASTGTASRFISFYAAATDENDGTGVGRIRLNNGNVAYETGGADYAEYVNISGSAGQGDIISIPSSTGKKALAGERIIGVVSGASGFVGNAKSEAPRANQAIVGFLGQIRTKVTGNIKPGDLVTASKIAGVGTKAKDRGSIVGIALEPHTGSGISKIKVFVNPGWYDPGTEITETGTAVVDVDIPDQLKVLGVEAKTGLFEKVTSTISAVFEKLTTKVADITSAVIDVLTVGSLTVGEADAPVGITVYDETTGEPYCVFVSAGELIHELGACK